MNYYIIESMYFMNYPRAVFAHFESDLISNRHPIITITNI